MPIFKNYKRMESVSFSNILVKYRHYYLIPFTSFLLWEILILTLFIIWLAKGKPQYGYYGTSFSSYIGYLGIQYPGFYLSFSILHSILFVISLYLEFYHRVVGKLVKFVEPKIQKRIAYISLSLGTLAQTIFVITTIVDYVKGMTSAHDTLLGVFVIILFFTLILNFINYYMLGRYFHKYVNGSYFNKFMVSFYLKCAWISIMAILVIVMTMLMAAQNFTKSVIVEWMIYFFYSFLLLFWTYDLMPLSERNMSNARNEEDHEMMQYIYRNEFVEAIS